MYFSEYYYKVLEVNFLLVNIVSKMSLHHISKNNYFTETLDYHGTPLIFACHPTDGFSFFYENDFYERTLKGLLIEQFGRDVTSIIMQYFSPEDLRKSVTNKEIFDYLLGFLIPDFPEDTGNHITNTDCFIVFSTEEVLTTFEHKLRINNDRYMVTLERHGNSYIKENNEIWNIVLYVEVNSYLFRIKKLCNTKRQRRSNL